MSGHQALLALHLLAIAAVFGIGFANLVNLRISKGQTGDVAKGLRMHRMAVNIYMVVGAIIILASGGLLLAQLGASPGGWFHVKMAAVLVWLVAIVVIQVTIRQMMKSGNMALITRIGTFAHIAVAAMAIALVCAVLAFAA
jgi:uncharacterized membrane protein